tara:strand:- start:354 stop:527 length:174 start_codon:yes stop_codon:yes gene_type:complete
VVKLCANVDLVVAQTNKFTFHSVDALEWVKVESVTVIDIPEANVLPELTGQKNGCKH